MSVCGNPGGDTRIVSADSPSWFERKVLRVQDPPMALSSSVMVLISLALVIGSFGYRVSHRFTLLDGLILALMFVAYPQPLLRSINDLRRRRA